ncbi:MAG: dihydroneopterin aldolase [Cyanobacteria bacterium P01_H01_bin.58]
MDTIHVNDIRVFGYTGALPEENVLGQWFRVDLEIAIALAEAGMSDILADTYNYADGIIAIQQLASQKAFRLVESLASEIARIILASDDRLSQIKVKLTKLNPPVPNFSGSIAVEITRDRTHLETASPEPLQF